MKAEAKIPHGWRVAFIRDIVNAARPVTYGVVQPGERQSIGIPLIRGKDYSSGKVSSDDIYLIHPHIAQAYRRSVVCDGDILLSIVGYVGQCAIVPEGLSGANITQTSARIAIDKGLCNRFFLHQFRGHTFQAEVRRYTKGSAQPGLNLTDVVKMRVLVPPLNEQLAIAEILDTADEAILVTERLIAKLEKAKQGLLRDLLTCGIDELSNLRDVSLNPGQFSNMSLGLLPKEWSVVPISDVAESITSGSRAWAAYYAESGALFLRIGNLTRKHINLRLVARSFVRPPMNAELRRTAVRSGDVLISITADLGIIGVVPDSLGEAYVNQHIALVRPTSRALGRWIGYFLSSYHAQAQFAMLNDAGAKAGLNLPAVGRLKIGLPRSVDERERIVAILDAYESEIVAHRASLAKLRSVKQGLMDDLLTGRVRMGDPG